MNARFDHDVFLVNQKHLALGKSKYYVYDEAQTPLFYIERPTMRMFGRRANIVVFDDDTNKQPLLEIQQDHGWEILKREDTIVDGESNETLGHLRRDNIRALFRRKWSIEDAAGTPFAMARETSAFMSFVRRAVDWIPYVSILGAMLFKTDFEILRGADAEGAKVGSFDRKRALTDKYVLNLRDDPERTFDRRMAVALGILLDTAEAR